VRLRVRNPNVQRQGMKCLVGLAEEQVVGRVRHERLVTHIAGDGATGSGADPPLVFKRWMKVVLVMNLPPVGPFSVPMDCSKRQSIAPAFGQLASEPAGTDENFCAHTLLLSKELCHVTLPKVSGLGCWGLYWDSGSA